MLLCNPFRFLGSFSFEQRIHSKPGEDTPIRVVLPSGAAAPVSAMSLATPPPPVRSLRILVVDDDPGLTESLRCTLEDDGHHVTVADGGQAGIDAFHSARQALVPFDIVITDLSMPHVNGRQVVASVRATSRETPIIMLTGWGQRQYADDPPAHHADRLLSKPPRLKELRNMLAELTSDRKER